MSQFNYQTAIDPATDGGVDLNTALDAWELALNSNHAGAARPVYAVSSMTWVQIVSGTVHLLNYYDGTDDILIATINPTTNSVSFANVVNTTGPTGAAQLPVGTTAQAPSAASGLARVNSTTNEPSVAVGSAYYNIANDRKGIAAGTVSVMTVAFARPILALANQLTVQVRSLGANTSTTPTINFNGLGAVTIVKNGNQPLVAGDIGAAGHEMLLSYTTANSGKVELLNPSLSSSVPQEQIITAWLSYNGVTNTIIDSFNIASVTDNGSGDYTLIFGTAMSSSNYSLSGFARYLSANVPAGIVSQGSTDSNTTTNVRIRVGESTTGNSFDSSFVSVHIFGGQ